VKVIMGLGFASGQVLGKKSRPLSSAAAVGSTIFGVNSEAEKALCGFSNNFTINT
jgi:hypothetical protein